MIEFLDQLERTAKASKTHRCRKRPTDINPYLVAYRGETPIAQVTLNQHDARILIDAAFVAAFGFNADSLGLVFETFIAGFGMDRDDKNQGLNPRTGRRWQTGEMQDLAENHDGCAKGWVTEAVCVATANRAGDIGWRSLPFRYVANKYLFWIEDPINVQINQELTDDGDAVNVRGPLAEELRRIMLGDADQHALPRDFGLDRQERDLSTAAYFAAKKHAPILFTQDGSGMEARMKKLGIQGVMLHEE